jgi:hypothetical protein
MRAGVFEGAGRDAVPFNRSNAALDSFSQR